MLPIDRRLLLGGGSAALLASGWRFETARAQDWKAEWEQTVAVAKKEGSVTVCASANASRRNFILETWSKTYPEITLSYQVVSGTRFVPQVVTERKAGKFLWDVWHNGPPSGLAALSAGLLDPVLPEFILPEVKDPKVWGGWDSAFYDPERKYLLGLFDDITAPYYNAKTLSPERVEKLGLSVLLEPDIKGKIVWLDPRVSGPGEPYLILLESVLGADALRRILTEQDPVFVNSENEVATAIVRGRGLVGLGNRPGEAVRQFVSAGLDLDIRPFGNTPSVGWRGTGGGTIGVFNQRPHPNAARVFVNWIATREVAVGMSKAQDLNSARHDVPRLDPKHAVIPGQKYVDGQRQEALAVMHKWQEEMKRYRPR